MWCSGPLQTTTVPTSYKSATSSGAHVDLLTFSCIGPLNMVSDSAYVVCFFPRSVTVSIRVHNCVIHYLLPQLQTLLQKHLEPIFISHIRSHFGLPGLMAQKYETSDPLVAPIFPVEKH